MNVFDFDKTIYKKDCSIEFYKFAVAKNPFLLLKCFLRQFGAIVQYKMGKITKEKLKERYFCFLRYINVDAYVQEFAEREINNIAGWYLDIKQENDVIISASPQFLVTAFTDRLGITYILATDMDKHTGKITGKNCRGEEKVMRFQKVFKDSVDCFYSDSMSDAPMARMAGQAYLVKKGMPERWDIEAEKKIKKN